MHLRLPAVALTLSLAACGGDVYLRDGLTDGDTFYLAQQALVDDDPALQSWVAYSLASSACKLAIGGDNPARASSFDCELMARRHLAEAWQEKRGEGRDAYLDDLLTVHAAGYLPEYVARHFNREGWELPAELDTAGFRAFSRRELGGHRPETRLIGSWNFARNVHSAF